MAVTPISPNMPNIAIGQNVGFSNINRAQSGQQSFSNVLNDVMNTVNETNAATSLDTEMLVTGNADDLHTMAINSAKAEIALSTVISFRNKILEAYNEVMRLNV